MRPIGEFELIERFTRPFARGEGVRTGIGDDAAVLRPPHGEEIVATVDAVVEGVHFTRGFSPEEIGWKSLAVNLSDLAAMGARPLWALVAIATPVGLDPRRLVRVGRGIATCARRHRVSVVGGNVTRAQQLSVTVTVLGSVARGRALLRSGARPGDLLVASGTLGDAALGLARSAPPALRERQRRPRPRVALGLAAVGLATAAIDLSDGLLQDLGHLCRASGVGARVEVERLPLSPAYRKASRSAPDPWSAALSGGEDYELLLAVPPARMSGLLRAARRTRTRVTPIGVLEKQPGIRILNDGRELRPRHAGHDHLLPGRELGRGRARA